MYNLFLVYPDGRKQLYLGTRDRAEARQEGITLIDAAHAKSDLMVDVAYVSMEDEKGRELEWFDLNVYYDAV